MARKNNPMRVVFEHNKYASYVDAINMGISIKDACRLMKCSRSWLHRYIQPHIHYVFVPGIVLAVARHSGDIALDRRESVYLDADEFDALIRKNMTYTRQAITVPAEALMQSSAIQKWHAMHREAKATYSEHCTQVRNGKELPVPRSIFFAGANNFYSSNLAQKYTLGDATKRSQIKPTRVKAPQYELKDLIAVHDVKDYGDSDELIYRDFFASGYYKLTLRVCDADGVPAEKIYYLAPPKDELDGVYNGESIGTKIIPYTQFRRYLKPNK